jgi:hypothetical protein
MRPSDVPTYVEAGAADLGITGKDVLLEQSQRKVYELLDLGYGRCEMVVAAPDGGDPIGDALRRLGRVRIATKYPRIASAYFERTGRQAEIVEVAEELRVAVGNSRDRRMRTGLEVQQRPCLAVHDTEVAVGDRVTVHHDVSDDDFRAWLVAADIAVDLRFPHRGEVSGSLSMAMVAGTPTIGRTWS